VDVPRSSSPSARSQLAIRVGFVVFGVCVLAMAVAYSRLGVALDALRARHAVGPAWSFPSRVYSAGVALTPGRALPARYLEDELDARGYRQVGGEPSTPGTWSVHGNRYDIALRGFQDAADPEGHGGPERVRVTLAGGYVGTLDRRGGFAGAPPPDLGHTPRLEPVPVATLLDAGRVRRTWVPLARIPRVVQDAVVASEDRRFWRHFGLDLRGNFRALVTNARAGGVRQGGSTITQQLARGLFLGRERTWGRKFAEMGLALGIELALTKQQILEMYLNSVYWGQGTNGGIGGIAEASRYYFGLPVESLRAVEAATLAGMIPAPNVYSPFRNPRLARARRNAVLEEMAGLGRLSPAMAARARAWPLDARRHEPPPDRYPSYVDYAREALGRALPAGAAEHWGLAVLTHLDLVWQEAAGVALAQGVDDQQRWRGRTPDPLQGAFVVLDPATSAVRVVVGGRDPQAGDFNRATRARRQTGSAIKPVVYAAALDPRRSGPRFTPASTVPDLRRTFDAGDTTWTPRNDEGEYHPQVTLAKALAKSLNVATSNVVEAVGAPTVARYAEAFGLGRMKPVASIGLGPNEVTLLALTNAYAVFPDGGVRHEPTPLRAVVDADGRSLAVPRARPTTVLPPEIAALMTGLLEDVVIYGVAYPLRADYGFTRPSGGKTGTTNDYNDAWYVGFTPDAVAGVWVGYDTPQSLNRPAAQSALPVWAGVMNRLLEDFPPTPFAGDAGLELAWIDPWSGKLAAAGCPVMRVPFLPGTAPRDYCTPPPDSARADSLGGSPADSLRP
jgi:penicillin-binding protein 1B